MSTFASGSPPALIPHPGKRHRWRQRLMRAAKYTVAVLIVAVASLTWWSLHVRTPLSPEQQAIQIQAAADLARARGWVWINTHSGIYHQPGTKWYGATNQGKYLPEWLAWIEGDRQAVNGQ